MITIEQLLALVVDAVMSQAIIAGAVEISPATDYGYRHGTIKDPFVHYWQIQKKILTNDLRNDKIN